MFVFTCVGSCELVDCFVFLCSACCLLLLSVFVVVVCLLMLSLCLCGGECCVCYVVAVVWFAV